MVLRARSDTQVRWIEQLNADAVLAAKHLCCIRAFVLGQSWLMMKSSSRFMQSVSSQTIRATDMDTRQIMLPSGSAPDDC
jgi:hypothetical protein